MKIQTSEVDRTDSLWHELDSFTTARNTATGVIVNCSDDADNFHLFVPDEAVAHCWVMTLSDTADEPTVVFTRKVELVKRSWLSDPSSLNFLAAAASNLQDLQRRGYAEQTAYALIDQTLPTPEEIVTHAEATK